MLDRTDFDLWKQRIRLYCQGKENEVNILKLIDEGPFQMGTVRAPLAEGTEGAPHLGPERPRVYSDLSPEEKDRETIHDYYVRFAKLINDMMNIKMTMSRMQLNSKFVNNMLPEWGRFVMAVKVNRGLRDSNYDLLYAYLKQNETHANENKMMLDRFSQHTVGPLALMSNVSHQQHYLQTSSTSHSAYVPPHLSDSAHLDSSLSPTDNLIENLTNTLAILTQSYKTFLPLTNNQLRTSSNTRNQATVQDGRVVVQNVQARQNKGQGINLQGGGATGYVGVQNRVGNANPGQARHVKCYNCNGLGHIARNFTQPKCPQNSKYYKDKMLLVQAQENRVALDAEQLLFLAGGQDNAIDEDVDEQPAPMAQTMFMANLSSVDPVIDEARPSFDLDILSEYVKENVVPVVHTNVSSIPNDAYMMIYNDMYEPYAQSVSNTSRNTVVENSLTAKLATYKEQVELYERRAKCELKEREQKINEQLRLVIFDRNFKEETLKKELHSIKLQLASTINHNKLMENFEGIQNALTKEIKEIKDVFEELEAEVAQNVVDRKHDAIERKNLLIANDNLIAECLSKEVFSVATNSELNVARFTEMHVANTIVEARCLELAAELSNLRHKSHNDNHDELVKRFSNLMMLNQCPRLRNNREAHLDYLRHLKESVETIREIVEDAKVVRPLDSSIVFACHYTKHSQELLEYAIGTCPQDSHQRDKKFDPAPLIRKKQVTFTKPSDTSNNNIHKHVVKLHTQQTNVHVPHSIGVNRYTTASGSQPKSNTKNNRIFPAKVVNKMQVEKQPRTNKSHLRTLNRVDSSSRPKRTVVQILLWYLDSGYSKHMMGDRSRLMNFMKKFIGTVRFGNDHFGAIMGYEDYVIGDNVISRVYYVEGLGHNLFFVGQFCDSDLEVAFKKHSYYVRDMGVELVKGSRESNLYTISVEDMMKSSSICLLSKASKNKSWLWHLCHAGPNPNDQDEGQAVPNIDEQAEGQAGPNSGDVAASQPLPSHFVHAGPNLEHMDLDVVDVLTQPHPEQMDEGTLSSLQYLTKDLSFDDLFFNDKPSKANNEKTTAKTKAKLMVFVTIQQDTSSIPSMTTPVIDLTSRPESPIVHQLLKATATETTTKTATIHPPPSQPQQSTTDSMLMKHIGELKHIMANLIQDNKHLEERLDSHGARLYTLENLDIPQQVSKAVDKIVTDVVDWAIQAPLRNRFRDLPEADMKEILHQRIWEANSYTTHKDHKMLYEALEKSMNRNHSEDLLKDLAEARKKKKKRHDSPKMPPGSSQVPPPPLPPPSTNQEGQSSGSAAPSFSKTGASAEYQAWTMTDTRLKQNAYILKVNLQQDWWKSLEEERPATPKPAWSIPSSDVPYQMEKCHKLLTDSVNESILKQNVSKPLPLGGPPGQVTNQSDFFFNNDLEYLRYGSKGSRPTLSISKMKATYYPDVGLEQMMLDQMWIQEECKHISKGDHKVVRNHMQILSVFIIEVFSMYGYDYMKKIVLRRADLNEHIIAERDFKYLYPMGFNSLVFSFRALSTLRHSGLRTANTAAKPCQGDSSELYLITDSIYTDQLGIVVLATLFNESEQRHFRSFFTNEYLLESRRLQLLAKEISIHNSLLTLQTHYQ
nr:integrase, catalytic region, zinc finger, CCHC-type, peptidase aspartic, catalytic [Tanacetum cinerariifolium]